MSCHHLLVRNPLPLDDSYDQRFRLAAMEYVRNCAEFAGGVVTRRDLEAFVFEGEQVRLIDTGRGIRNPRQLPATISLLMDPLSHYAVPPRPPTPRNRAVRRPDGPQADREARR